jgi:hypothetical protein
MTADKKKVIRDILIRAGKTFVQAFISYLSIDAFFGVTDLGAFKKIALSLLVGALAAGVSAVWNSLLEWINRRIEEMDEEDSSDG